MKRFAFLLLPVFGALLLPAQDTATFKDGFQLTYQLIENHADRQPPVYIYTIPQYSDVRFCVQPGFGTFIRNVGYFEGFAGVGPVGSAESGSPEVGLNKWGAQGWLFLLKKEKTGKNSITIARKGIYGGYVDYKIVVDVVKRRCLAAHFAYTRKTYLAQVGSSVEVDGDEYSVVNAYAGEFAVGVSLVSFSNTKWKVFAGEQQETFREGALFRVTLDFLYYAQKSAEIRRGFGQSSRKERAPQGVVDAIFARKAGFRFLWDGYIPVSPSRLNYGFTYQFGAVLSPLEKMIDYDIYPVIGVGIYVRPDLK